MAANVFFVKDPSANPKVFISIQNIVYIEDWSIGDRLYMNLYMQNGTKITLEREQVQRFIPYLVTRE
jgi:hypothetical protein